MDNIYAILGVVLRNQNMQMTLLGALLQKAPQEVRELGAKMVKDHLDVTGKTISAITEIIENSADSDCKPE